MLTLTKSQRFFFVRVFLSDAWHLRKSHLRHYIFVRRFQIIHKNEMLEIIARKTKYADIFAYLRLTLLGGSFFELIRRCSTGF